MSTTYLKMFAKKHLIVQASCCLLRWQNRHITSRYSAAQSCNFSKGSYSTIASTRQNNKTQQMVNAASPCQHLISKHKHASIQTAIVDRISPRRNFSSDPEYLTSKKSNIDYTLHETVLNAADANYHVSYVDEGDKNKPVVLCLHGMPACHKDFLPILPQLVDGGARVILVNFPGVGYSWHLEGAPFDYSHLTKARLVEALLSHLGINKIDMLVSKSSSGHSGMELCANTDLVKSVTFVSAIAHLPHGQSKKTIIRDTIYHLLKYATLRRLIGPTVLSIFRKVAQMPIPEVEFFFGLTAESRTWNWKQAEADLKKINHKGMPAVVLGAYKDPIVQSYITKGVMDLLAIPEEDRLTYTKDNTWQPADRKGKVNPLKHGIMFEKSTHWIPKSHPDIVANMILDFLKATQQSR